MKRARVLTVYNVADPQGPATFPTLKLALAEARERARLYREQHDESAIAYLEVQRVTIPGPFNRDLVCRLLTHGGYASQVETVWRAKEGR